jgi:phosphatidylglycerol:prolipoprotein diacylglycerol transferase
MMIPYIEIPPLPLGGDVAIQPFGLLVVIGCIIGFFAFRWYAGTLDLPQNHLLPLFFWALVPGFVLAHWLSVILYFPELLDQKPSILLNIGASMSSFGGFLGGSIGAVLYLKKHHLPILAYGDALVFGLTVGWFFGRLGCTVAHDHPGVHSDFFLAVQYPDGPRHDLGFYEWLLTIVLLGILLLIRTNVRMRPGMLIGIVCILYAPVRFFLDFLRAADRLYFGLTPGQYFALLLLPVGFAILIYALQQTPRSAKARLGRLPAAPPDTVAKHKSSSRRGV